MSLFQHILTTVVLVALDCSIYREVRKRTKWLEKNVAKNPKTDYRRREITIALLLVTVILVFLVCHALRCLSVSLSSWRSFLVRLLSLDMTILTTIISDMSLSPSWVSCLSIMVPASHFLLTLNSSCNILIYCAKDKQFWVVCLNTLKCWAKFRLVVRWSLF